MKRKPNYALRRKVALIILILILLSPVIIINRVKILNLSLYTKNIKYASTINALFNSNYSKDEAEKLLNSLKKKKMINKNTPNYILKFNSKGYNKKTINYVLNNLNSKEITNVLSKNYNKEFEKYINLDLFDYDNYNRYLEFHKKNKDLNLDEVVTRVELNLDKEYYEDSIEEKNCQSTTCLVNKHRYLSENFEPNDLVDMDDKYANNRDGQKRLRKEAYKYFTKMVDDAKKVGINFYAESAFRTFSHQELIYNSYLSVYGREKTDTFAARPGYSEHQTGLTVDLANTWTIKEGSEEYDWIDKNGYKYGYIIRYKPEKESITGYGAESWHIRYVGKKIATFIHENDITFDEYYIKYLNKKNNNK